MHRLLGVALCSVFVPLASAHAQNLLTNPKFNHDLSGWVLQQGSAVWSTPDAGASRSPAPWMRCHPVDFPTSIRSSCFAASGPGC